MRTTKAVSSSEFDWFTSCRAINAMVMFDTPFRGQQELSLLGAEQTTSLLVVMIFERNIIYQFRFDTNSDANAGRDWWFLYAIGCITKNNSYRQDAPIRVIAHIL